MTVRELDTLASPKLDVDHIHKAFAAARANGVRKPVIRVDGFKFKMPSEYSANAGGIYVNDTSDGFDEYLGKVVGGQFLPTAAAAGRAGEVNRALANPLQAMLDYGKKYGACSICARKLSDPASVRNGIGPICAGKFGFKL